MQGTPALASMLDTPKQFVDYALSNDQDGYAGKAVNAEYCPIAQWLRAQIPDVASVIVSPAAVVVEHESGKIDVAALTEDEDHWMPDFIRVVDRNPPDSELMWKDVVQIIRELGLDA